MHHLLRLLKPGWKKTRSKDRPDSPSKGALDIVPDSAGEDGKGLKGEVAHCKSLFNVDTMLVDVVDVAVCAPMGCSEGGKAGKKCPASPAASPAEVAAPCVGVPIPPAKRSRSLPAFPSPPLDTSTTPPSECVLPDEPGSSSPDDCTHFLAVGALADALAGATHPEYESELRAIEELKQRHGLLQGGDAPLLSSPGGTAEHAAGSPHTPLADGSPADSCCAGGDSARLSGMFHHCKHHRLNSLPTALAAASLAAGAGAAARMYRVPSQPLAGPPALSPAHCIMPPLPAHTSPRAVRRRLARRSASVPELSKVISAAFQNEEERAAVRRLLEQPPARSPRPQPEITLDFVKKWGSTIAQPSMPRHGGAAAPAAGEPRRTRTASRQQRHQWRLAKLQAEIEKEIDAICKPAQIAEEEGTLLVTHTLPLRERWAAAALLVCMADECPDPEFLRLIPHLRLRRRQYLEVMGLRGQRFDPKLFVEYIQEEHHWAILWDSLILAIEDGRYDARTRVSIRRLVHIFNIPWERFMATEDGLAVSLRQTMSAVHLENNASISMDRLWKIGIGALVGGCALMLSGGFAAPFLIPAVTSVVAGATSALGLGTFTVNTAVLSVTGAPLIAGLFGAAGAGMGGIKVAKRTAGVEEFLFEPIGGVDNGGGMCVWIGVSGWLVDEADSFTAQWHSLYLDNPFGEHYALRWVPRHLTGLGDALHNFLETRLAGVAARWWALHASKAVALISGAIQWPLAVMALADLIDNPWHMAVDRADKAALVLADVLCSGAHGQRPVSLVGYSVGARLIFNCLRELARRGCVGVVETVVLMGAPVSTDLEEWDAVARVVAGRLVNEYSTNDWVLLFLYRTAHLSRSVAGAVPVPHQAVENVNVSHLVSGHLAYSAVLPMLLAEVGLDRGFQAGKSYVRLLDSV